MSGANAFGEGTTSKRSWDKLSQLGSASQNPGRKRGAREVGAGEKLLENARRERSDENDDMSEPTDKGQGRRHNQAG